MTKRAPNPPLMATPNLFAFLLIFTFLCNSPKINSSSCTLNLTKYPYEVNGNCVDMSDTSAPSETIRICCGSALRSLFRAMAARTNQSHDQSIFLSRSEARNCSGTFQNLHRSINLSRCGLEDEIVSSRPDFNDVGDVVNVLGLNRYNNLRFSCSRLSESEYSDEACLDCLVAYRETVSVLEESVAMGRREAKKAILVSLASSSDSANWVRGTSSCLWSEIELSYGSDTQKKRHHLNSKEVIAMVIVAAAMLVVTPILYQVTKRQLHRSSQKDIEDLSIKVIEDDSARPCKELPLLSQNKIAKHIENK